MDQSVAKSKGVGDLQVGIGEHDGLEPMSITAVLQFLDGAGAHSENLDAALVEFRPESFPSPQLGDTVGSPMGSEELDQDQMALQAFRVEPFAEFVDG